MGSEPDITPTAVEIAQLLDVAVFLLLAVLGLARWLRRRDAATGWFAAMFGLLGAVVAISAFTDGDAPLLVAALSLFPFLLLRFTATFTSPRRGVQLGAGVATVVVFVWSLVVDLPPDGVAPDAAAAAFIASFLVLWCVLSVSASWFFVREAARYPGVAARRMRLFAFATLLLAILLLVSGLTGGAVGSPALDVAVQVGAVLSALLFLAAFSPPQLLRRAWLAREFEGLHQGMRELVLQESVDDVRESAIAIVRQLTGCSDAWIVVEDDDLHPVDRDETLDVVRVDRFVLVIGRAAPWFGATEQRLVSTLARFLDVAEDQARVIERERAANEKLRQVDQLKSEFVAMVAHDIRSPMSVITGFADTIHDRWDEFDDDRKRQYLQLISRNTQDLSAFVEDVLEVARIDAGGLQYETEPFDAKAVVERMVAEMRVAHPHLRLELDITGELPKVVGDADRNRQILANLIDNARKFSGDLPRILIQLSPFDEREVAIAVCDNGVGIDPDDLPLLFRRFSRVGPTRRKVSGTGLGLYIVKSMVEAQGGRIWVESEPGRGSKFTYTLPADVPEVAA